MQNIENKITTIRTLPLFLIFFFFALIGTIIIGVSLTNKKQVVKKSVLMPTIQKGVALSLAPSTQSVSKGQEFTEDIIIDTKDQIVSGAELYVAYDATKMQALEIKEGSFLPVILAKGTIKNGLISITLGCQPSSPQKGSGVLATIKFKLLSTATSDITFTDKTWVSAINNKTGNTVESKTGATISVFQMFKNEN